MPVMSGQRSEVQSLVKSLGEEDDETETQITGGR